MSDPLIDLSVGMAVEAGAKMDAAVGEQIHLRLGRALIPGEVRMRMSSHFDPETGANTIFLDGNPIIQFGRLQLSSRVDEFGTTLCTATRSVRTWPVEKGEVKP